MYKIAIVEDDPDMGDYFVSLLGKSNFDVALYSTAGRFFDSLAKQKPDLVLLDMHLPGMHGKEIIRVLRANPETRRVYLIAMSGRERKTEDVVKGFQAGADEYLVKPIDSDLLLVRINALLRRDLNGAAPAEDAIRLEDLVVSPDHRSCVVAGKEVQLTRLEFDLLVYFLKQINRVLTRSVILESVWHGDPTMTTRTVDKHVESLRKKLGAFGKKLETVIRVGYVLKVT